MDSQDHQSIAEFYRNKSVLITGATGFIGKVLVEKLLRSCPDIGTIYVLMRPKRGQQVSGRLSDLFNTVIYDELRKDSKHSLSKVVSISGDLTSPNMGLSQADRDELIANVSVVFHSAATIKFDDPLSVSINMNVCGTIRLLELCEAMHKLESMVHLSTAYCHCDKKVTNEIVYTPTIDAHKVISAVKILDDEMLETVTPQILAGKPNTYTYTKSLGEQVVYEQSGKLPIAIVRPSIVIAAEKEPIPGWIDNLNGPTGLLVAASKGIFRSMCCDMNCIADMIPVDYVINCIIAVSWYTATHRPHDIIVYNCCTGADNPITWGRMLQDFHNFVIKYPPRKIFWYPGGGFKTNKLQNNLAIFFLQKIPAYITDFAAWLMGRKPIMVNLQEKLIRAMEALHFFSMREFKFTSENTQKLLKCLKEEDKIKFDFDVKNINWKTYIESYVLGIRGYILKEDISSVPEARANLRKMRILHYLTKILFFLFTCWFFLFRIKAVRKVTYHTLSYLFQTSGSILRKTIAFDEF